MAFVTRGRIVSRAAAASGRPLLEPQTSLRSSRILEKPVVDAHLAANAITEGARERARIEARAEVEAELSARFLALRAREEARAQGDLGNTVKLATLLAERLLGAALELQPDLIATMAQAALSEARGARRAVIEVCPLDADALRENVAGLGLPPECLEVRPNAELGRGSLSLHTDLGTLDARLKPQLEQLAAALHDALRG